MFSDSVRPSIRANSTASAPWIRWRTRHRHNHRLREFLKNSFVFAGNIARSSSRCPDLVSGHSERIDNLNLNASLNLTPLEHCTCPFVPSFHSKTNGTVMGEHWTGQKTLSCGLGYGAALSGTATFNRPCHFIRGCGPSISHSRPSIFH